MTAAFTAVTIYDRARVGAARVLARTLREHHPDAALLASSVADSANAPLDAPDTGAMAATFLRPFAGDVAWAHIDNGSSAWLERPWAEWPEGPTGTPLRALVEYLVPSR